MSKKGFTLIELLAVIVILAIIALIATPIVLSIINDTKKSSMLRSAEMYLNGVENAVMKANMNEDGNYRPNDCTITNGLVKCDDYEGIAVEVDGEVPQDGSTIKFENGKIIEVRLVYKSATIVMDEKNNLVFADDAGDTGGTTENTLATICTLVSGTEKTAGSKYTCEVKPGTSYNFYVLTTPADGAETIDLIMDRNICEDGTLTDASKGDKCKVAWNNESGQSANAYGPVTAMDYLYNATKDWTNIPNIEMNYTDEGNTGSYGYGTIVTTDNITKITKKDGTAVTVLTDKEGYSNLKARLPYKSEVSAYDSTNKTNAYLYDYLNQTGTIQTNTISGIYGYWTLSSSADYSDSAWIVDYGGNVSLSDVYYDHEYGVRAVINLKI